MVKGLDIFRRHFQGFADRYFLIGGSACDILMSEAGLEFRATKDLDIVLCIETIDREFVESFWSFVADGRYSTQQKSTGEKQFYRFQKPEDEKYPFMLELFSRRPDILTNANASQLTPLPMEEEISSLSAILMDRDYYEFIRAGRKQVAGISVVGPERLVPLKARAWLDLNQRKSAGEAVDSRSIKKHKNDVFRLYRIIDPVLDPAAPETVKRDLRNFIGRMETEEIDLNALGMPESNRNEILVNLRRIYRLD